MVVRPPYSLSRWLRVLALGLALLRPAAAPALVVNVVDPDGKPVGNFRWLAQEDSTPPVIPGATDPRPLSVRFHASAMPVAAAGHAAATAALRIDLDPAKRYFLSVLPDSGHTLGGAPVAAGQAEARVVVSKLPLPPARLSVFVFQDDAPLNGRPDPPRERGLAGFRIHLADAAGRQMMDAFGNPIGTTYDAAGKLAAAGPGYVLSDPDGEAAIPNLPPGEVAVSVTPPPGEGWVRTAAQGATPGGGIALRPGEPLHPLELGAPGGHHAAFGFVKAMDGGAALAGGRTTIRGAVAGRHASRPPDGAAFPGEPVPGAWVGLNEPAGGRALYAAPCDPATGAFAIPRVPPGDYQLVVWDEPLDFTPALRSVTVPAGRDLELGRIPVARRFARLANRVFLDRDADGFPDPGEPGLAGERLNLRWRDGALYQTATTDARGECVFGRVFPFMSWLAAEAAPGRLWPSGVTAVADGGGAVKPDACWAWPSRGVLAPQPQFDDQGRPAINPNTNNHYSRTESGPAWREAFQLFAGQGAEVSWGRKIAGGAAGGGIAGMVYYATTRAEDDPCFAEAEPWEPGVARVPVNLYLDADRDGAIDDADGDGAATPADVDHAPFTWRSAPYAKGPEDLDRNGNGRFDRGDAAAMTTTDSWDDAPPAGAQGPKVLYRGAAADAFDGPGNFNQLRPGVFDGHYEFTTISLPGRAAALPEGTCIVEACPPPGYRIVKEEDKNVDFGDTYQPMLKAMARELPPPPVGEPHLVPPGLSLFPGVAGKFAGRTRPLADRKQVAVSRGQFAACDFHIFTEVPLAGQIVGRIHEPLAGQGSPGLGALAAPPWLPVSIRDFAGREVSRVYADAHGAFSALVPSTYSNNAPTPSGVAGGVWTVVVNSSGPILDVRPGSPTHGQSIADPFYDRRYGQAVFTVRAMPGRTACLDAPLARQAAFAGSERNPLDTAPPDGTPLIRSVSGPGGGPVVAGAGQRLTIEAAGPAEVPNPLDDGTGAHPKTVGRDYGFGAAPGRVTLGGVALASVAWSPGSITATVPAGARTGQLIVTRASGKASPSGVTVTVGPPGGAVRVVRPSSAAGAHPIQDAIDAAAPGDLILVAPGRYAECVIVWKPVRLQGWGAASVAIDAAAPSPDRLRAWREKVRGLVAAGKVDLPPGQLLGLDGGEAPPLADAEGAAILVLGRRANAGRGGFGPGARARIDGLTVTGGSGGGIVVNGCAGGLEISNNVIIGNQGLWGGGIRSGHPGLVIKTADGPEYGRCENENLHIHHNQICGNGGRAAAGGGLALYAGSDGYRVESNFIAGNFTAGSGGGIGHLGLSRGGRIDANLIAFNQSFGVGSDARGGGVFIGGAAPLAGDGPSSGAGSVTLAGNAILGNQAGSGDGGGLALARVNGLDVAARPGDPDAWWRVDLVNNTIVNNQAGLAGGALALCDAARVNVIHNTIARNESTATAGEAFAPGSPNRSTAQPGGLVARAHSAALAAAFGPGDRVRPYRAFSNPLLVNNIIWRNRSFYFQANPGSAARPFALLPGAPLDRDLAVLGAPGARLNPLACLLTDRTGYDASNAAGDPHFTAGSFNGDRAQALARPESPGPMSAAPAFGSGGDAIEVRFGPLALTNPATGKPFSDARLLYPSPAIGAGSPAVLGLLPEAARDADGQPRPNAAVEAGADEFYPPGSAANPAPLALDDAFTFKAGTLGAVAAPGVLANDLAAAGAPLRAQRVVGPAHGVLVLRADGSFSYSPAAGFKGTDSFTYRTGDGRAASNAARVTLRVGARGNTPPAAAPDAYFTEPGQALTVAAGQGVLANDADPDGDAFFAQLTARPARGALALRPGGAFVYTPPAGFSGTVTFRYRPADAGAGQATTVMIAVGRPAAPNRPPAPWAAALMATANTPAHLRVMPGDPDPDDLFTYALALRPAHGKASVSPAGIVTYTPAPGYTGPDNLTVRVTDQAGASGRVIVSIFVAPRLAMPGGIATQFVPDTDGVDSDGDGRVNNDHVMIHLGAGDGFVKMADGKVTYVFGFINLAGVASDRVMMDATLKAECPGQTIRVREGQRVYLNLTNTGMTMRPDLPAVHALRWLGQPGAAPFFGGAAEAAPAIRMGGTFTSWFLAGAPGTYLYYCGAAPPGHARMGMIGNLIVTPRQDGRRIEFPPGSGRFLTRFAYDDGDGSTGYDLDVPIQLSAFNADFHDAMLSGRPTPPAARTEDDYPLINGRGYPDTVVPGWLPAPPGSLAHSSQKMSARIEVHAGQRILLRVSNLNAARFYTLASTGIPMQVVGINAKQLRGSGGRNLYYQTMSLTTGGGETYDAIMDTAGVAPGTYFLYAANLDCLGNGKEDFGGMMTEVVIR